MSSDSLSPDQITALFEAARSGQVPEAAGTPRRQPRLRSVDFSRPTKFSSDHQRRIARALDTFCATAGTRLSAELRAPVEFETINTMQLTWSAAQALLPSHSIAVTLEADPIATRMVLMVESVFALAGIECLLGGSADRAPRERRFSEIDWALTRRLLTSLVSQLSAVWRDLGGVSFSLGEIESHTDSSAIASVSEPTFAAVIEARLNRRSSSISLLIPWQAIDPISDRVAGRDTTSGAEGIDTRMGRALAAAPITLRAEVAAVDLEIADILSLGPGSIVRLGGRAEAGISLFAENTRLGRAKPGVRGARRAVQILGAEGLD
ncbi:flagellar motor switch protein FliM [Conexibacter sp. DBS9H8]|uniref:flagellar motor switch protein FliM n=1 Tax=Conexibacter sp. DBS9H8 TaxID=2937801 RepID=UPI002010C6B9|nr:FliM/FliN family flagellar motor switch protein [Conexibacter sp. DBS9H8]